MSARCNAVIEIVADYGDRASGQLLYHEKAEWWSASLRRVDLRVLTLTITLVFSGPLAQACA